MHVLYGLLYGSCHNLFFKFVCDRLSVDIFGDLFVELVFGWCNW